MYSFNGIPVILSEHMIESITKKVYRNYRPGQRHGKNKSLRKLVYAKSFIVPSENPECNLVQTYYYQNTVNQR